MYSIVFFCDRLTSFSTPSPYMHLTITKFEMIFSCLYFSNTLRFLPIIFRQSQRKNPAPAETSLIDSFMSIHSFYRQNIFFIFIRLDSWKCVHTLTFVCGRFLKQIKKQCLRVMLMSTGRWA